MDSFPSLALRVLVSLMPYQTGRAHSIHWSVIQAAGAWTAQTNAGFRNWYAPSDQSPSGRSPPHRPSLTWMYPLILVTRPDSGPVTSAFKCSNQNVDPQTLTVDVCTHLRIGPAWHRLATALGLWVSISQWGTFILRKTTETPGKTNRKPDSSPHISA